jgi:hypothetical protein
MRAVSLSHPDVRKLLSEEFVCTWSNIAADPAAGASHPHACADQARDMARGLGEHNTQTLILTPDGRLLTALAGYIGPADLLEELKMATSLWKKIANAPEASARRSLEQAHSAFAGEVLRRKGRDGLVGQEEQFFGQLKEVGNKRVAADHRFSAAHPLMPAENFTTALLVGNAKSAFVSQVAGNGTPAIANSASGAPGILSLLDQPSGKSGGAKKAKR